MRKLAASPAITKRLSAFIGSDAFVLRSRVAKSEYWKYYGNQLHTRIGQDSVEVTGDSGFYVPQQSSLLKRLTSRSLRAVRQPAKIANWIGRNISSHFDLPRSMPHAKAFDAVMGHADVSCPIMSAFTIDHLRLSQCPKVFATYASVKQHYQKWSGYQASPNVINHYYYQNILRGVVANGHLSAILEIGPGNGNLSAILYHDWAPVRMVLVDLPETLAVSIPFLSSLFPRANIAMPNEIQVDGFPGDFDFAFLTPDQLDCIEDDSIDLAVNCHSFQEMTHTQIRIYIELIQRVCRNCGFFFSANRVEKIPCGPEPFVVEQPDPPNRVAEYPWVQTNKLLVYEISRFSRLVQLDGVALRLEVIRKGQ